MKKFAVAVTAALAITLAGCTAPDIDEATVTKVQAATAKACRFVPAASAVASILTDGNPIVATVAGATTAICTAFNAKPMTLFSSGEEPKPEDCVVVVEGVCVPGEPVEPGDDK